MMKEIQTKYIWFAVKPYERNVFNTCNNFEIKYKIQMYISVGS